MLTGPGGADFGWSVWTRCEASNLGFMHCCSCGGGLAGARRSPTWGWRHLEPAQCIVLWFTGNVILDTLPAASISMCICIDCRAISGSTNTTQSRCWQNMAFLACTLSHTCSHSCRTAALTAASQQLLLCLSSHQDNWPC